MWLLLTAGKEPCVLGNIKAVCCFFGYKGPEFFVSVQNVLVLIAVTGEDISDERFGLSHQKAVFISVPFYPGKIRAEIGRSVFSAEFFVKFFCGQDDPAVKVLDQAADLFHMVCAVSAAEENALRF